MAYTEFYVTKGSSASDLNAGYPLGANDGPTIIYDGGTNPLVNSGGSTANPYTLTTANAATWTGVSVGDFFTYDTASTKIPFRVVTVPGTANITANRLDGATGALATTTNATCRFGGAYATIAGILLRVKTGWVNASGDPPRVNVKNTSGYTENPVITNAGTASVPITIEGYSSTAGDGGIAAITGNITGAIAFQVVRGFNITGYIGSAGASCHWENITVTSGAAAAAMTVGANCNVIGCTVSTSIAAQNGIVLGNYCQALGCTASGGSSAYAFSTGTFCSLSNCIARTGTRGYNLSATSCSLINCTARGPTTGIYVTVPTAGNTLIANCICDTCTTGINVSAATFCVHGRSNAFYNCGTNVNANAKQYRGVGDVTLTASPFVNGSSGDFRINTYSAGGRALISAGYPTNINGQLSYINIGATDPAYKRSLSLG